MGRGQADPTRVVPGTPVARTLQALLTSQTQESRLLLLLLLLLLLGSRPPVKMQRVGGMGIAEAVAHSTARMGRREEEVLLSANNDVVAWLSGPSSPPWCAEQRTCPALLTRQPVRRCTGWPPRPTARSPGTTEDPGLHRDPRADGDGTDAVGAVDPPVRGRPGTGRGDVMKSGLDLVALMVDGVHFAESCCVVALGIDIDGVKHPLALVEGSTETRPWSPSCVSGCVSGAWTSPRRSWRSWTGPRRCTGPCATCSTTRSADPSSPCART